MEKREDNPMEIYNRGKNIVELLEKYSSYMTVVEDGDKEKLKEKLMKLNDAKETIKEEIYEEAKKKSGLDYSKKEKNPELLRKEYNERLADLRKRKHELRLEKIRIEKYNEQKMAQIREQFKMAAEKYKQMLDMGKITKELYESRIENMKEAELKDRLDLSDKLFEVKNESDKIDSEVNNIKNNLKELEKKEIIYNEYGDVYYRLFGEVLADRNKLDIPKEKKENKEKVEKDSEPEEIKANENKAENIVKENQTKDGKEEKGNSNSNQNSVKESENVAGETEKEVEPDIIVTSKTMFNNLYKKMKKGVITDKELSALADTLSNPDNYDKYGITTGLVFNKARKILKLQGARTAKNIEKFLRDNNVFNDDIKFDSSVEKGNILSHDILNSWKDIDEKLTYTDSAFSIEKYIEKIEKYKLDGNDLTKVQEETLKKAIDIKNNLKSYRKAINVNDDVTTSRDKRDRNSIFYIAFKNRQKSKSSRALPEGTGREDNAGFIVMARDSGLNLSDLTNIEPTPEEAKNSRTSNTDRSKDKVL